MLNLKNDLHASAHKREKTYEHLEIDLNLVGYANVISVCYLVTFYKQVVIFQ